MANKPFETKSFKLEIKSLNEESGEFEGYAAVFGNVDDYGDMIMPGAFTKTLSEKKSFPLTWTHDWKEVLGLTTAEQDNYGLKIKGFLNLAVQMAREKYALLKQGAIKYLSITYRAVKSSVNISGIRQLGELKLFDTALCIVPVNNLAEVTEVKAVIPYHDYGQAAEGEAWDGKKEVAKADTEELKKICAWYDSEDADNKGAYKLPHHHIDGHKAVWKGVAAAMAALLGARGGVAIPSGDRKGVYSHLAKHYAEFEKEPPEFKSMDEIQKSQEGLQALFESTEPPDGTQDGEPPDLESKSGSHLLTELNMELMKFNESLRR